MPSRHPSRVSLFSLLLAIAPSVHGMGQAPPPPPMTPPDGAPMFVPHRPVAVGRGSGTPILADVNGDGHQDLMTRFLLAREVSVHLGDGYGEFSPAPGSPLRFPYPPAAAAAGDLNRDGVPDLIVAPAYEDSLDVWLGSASGFRQAPGSPFGAGTPVQTRSKRALYIEDLDGDGHLDAITANGRNGTLVRFLGDGKGGLGDPAVTAFDPSSSLAFRTFAFGDVDGDRDLDVVVGTHPEQGTPGGGVQILLGEGRGQFGPARRLEGLPVGRMSLGDVDGDGARDLVVSHDDGLLSVFLNDGQASFRSAPGSPIYRGVETWNVTIRDFDGDGRNDILAATVDSVTVLLAKGAVFTQAPGSPYPAGPGAFQLAVGDVSSDGRPDIVASSFEGDGVAILLGR